MKRVTLALTFALAPILASVGAQADTLKTVDDLKKQVVDGKITVPTTPSN